MPENSFVALSPADTASQSRAESSILQAWFLVLLTGVILAIVRFTAPSDFMAYAQDMPATYTLDAVKNGQWICQQDAAGDVTSKPPLYTWLSALVSWPSGNVSEFSMRLPSAIATILTGLAIFAAGRSVFGWKAGLWAALGYLLCPFVVKQIALIRTDALFTLTVTLAALAAFRAWQTGHLWIWFWLAGAAATLTKGPLGLLLAGAGLLAVMWEKRSGHPTSLSGRHWLGVALFLLIGLGWFVSALSVKGWGVFHEIIVSELLEHAVQGNRGALPGQHAYLPILYMLSRFAPWSIPTCVGLWRVIKHPATTDTERQFERFLFCWLAFGLVLFSIAAHVRPDLLFPIVPPAALLAGRECARWLEGRLRSPLFGASVVCALALVGIGCYSYAGYPEHKLVVRTQGVRETADWIRSQVGEDFPLTYVDRTFGVQFYLNTMRVMTSTNTAAELLRGPDPAFVVVRDFDSLEKALGDDAGKVNELWRWPQSGEAYLRVISNHPKLEWTDRLAWSGDGLLVRLSNVRGLTRPYGHFRMEAGGPDANATFTNQTESPISVQVEFDLEHSRRNSERTLSPGESWTIAAATTDI